MRMIGKLSACALVAATLLPLTDAVAVTLGRVRGAALIGRPINVTVPVTLPTEAFVLRTPRALLDDSGEDNALALAQTLA